LFMLLYFCYIYLLYWEFFFEVCIYFSNCLPSILVYIFIGTQC
jgi:hypothetical protein